MLHEVHDAEPARAVLVHDVGEIAPVPREHELVHVPRDVVGERRDLARREVGVAERAELAAEVGREIHALAVAREVAAARGLHLRRLDLALLARREVVDPEVALVGRHEMDRAAATSRPGTSPPRSSPPQAPRRPAAGAMRSSGSSMYTSVATPVRAVHWNAYFVPSGDHTPVSARPRPSVSLTGSATDGIEILELVVLVAARVADEGDALARAGRRPVAVVDRLVEEGDLAARAQRLVHDVQLVRVAEARADRDAPVGRPAGEGGAARELVAAHALLQLGRNLGDALDREVAAGDALDFGRAGAEGAERAGERLAFSWADSNRQPMRS